MRLAELSTGQLPGQQHGDWVLPVNHFSPTMLKMAMTCLEQFRHRYILKKRERPGAAAILGSADHFAHEHNFTQKIETGVDIDTDEVIEAFHHGWEEKLDEAGGASEVKWNESPDAMRAHGELMVKTYHEGVSPRIQPIAVESEFHVGLGSVPVPVMGKIDLVRGDPETRTATTITERKTSKAKQSKPKPAWSLQGRVYRMARGLPTEWHVVTKAKTPTIWTPLEAEALYAPYSDIEARSTQKLLEGVGWQLNALYARFGPDEPWPGTGITHDWACGYCGFAPNCDWVRK